MNVLKQAKDEEFIKEQFVKGRILDDTKDYGRTQFVDEIYKLQQENQQLKIQISAREEEYKKLEQNWNKLKEYIEEEWYCFDNESVEYKVSCDILDEMEELEEKCK